MISFSSNSQISRQVLKFCTVSTVESFLSISTDSSSTSFSLQISDFFPSQSLLIIEFELGKIGKIQINA
jgi:hypothetical protein